MTLRKTSIVGVAATFFSTVALAASLVQTGTLKDLKTVGSTTKKQKHQQYDLVVDTSDFLVKLAKSKPWIIRKVEKPLDEEYFQTPEQLDTYKQFSMCINCMLCYAACPVYGLDPLFSGPAAIALAQRYNLDSRDEGASDRLDILSHHEGIWGCTFVGECTQVCPKHVDPAGAIQQYKLTATMEWVKSLVLPRGAK